MLRPSLAFAFSSLLLACSGSSFEVAEDTDAATEETGCTKNACGGCTTLTHDKGTTCGVCGGGKYDCSGTDDTTCLDPVTTPAPKTACGVCNTGTWECEGTLTTKCKDPITKDLPDTACGVCNTGKWTCAADGTECKDPVTTPIGTKCGTCGTSTFQCSASTPGADTACAKPDDRTSGADAFYTATSGSVWTLSSPVEPVMIAFTMQRIGSITDVALGLSRYDSGSITLFGSLTVRLLRGSPTGDVLATVSFPADSIPDTPGPVSIKLPTPTEVLAKGTRVYIELTDNSARYNFGVFGGSPTGPAHLGLFYKSSTPSGSDAWVEYTTSDPYLKITESGCF